MMVRTPCPMCFDASGKPDGMNESQDGTQRMACIRCEGRKYVETIDHTLSPVAQQRVRLQNHLRDVWQEYTDMVAKRARARRVLLEADAQKEQLDAEIIDLNQQLAALDSEPEPEPAEGE